MFNASVYLTVKQVDGCKLIADFGLKNFCDFRNLQLLMVKEDAGALRALFSFQLDGYHHKVMITADVCTRECLC